MKISCSREKLKERITQAERVTGKNIGLPILGSILLRTEKNILTVLATNLNVGVEFKVPAKIEKEGEVAVPANIVTGIFSGLSSGQNVELEKVNENLVISNNKNTTLVKSFNSEDFPIIPRIKNGISFKVAIESIVLGAKSVWYASATSDIKPEISSVYMYCDNDSIVFVSTDSFRLAEKKIKNVGKVEFDGVILPIKNIHDIIKILETVTGECMVTFDKNQISFETEEMYLTSRVVNGNYPDYRQIIPKAFTSEITVVKEDILSALKLTNVFADKFNKIKIKADAERKTFEISSRNSDVGENMTTIDATTKGDSFDVNFNYRYIQDGFQSIHSDSVVLKYDSKREVLIVAGTSDASFIYLVKPMNK